MAVLLNVEKHLESANITYESICLSDLANFNNQVRGIAFNGPLMHCAGVVCLFIAVSFNKENKRYTDQK